MSRVYLMEDKRIRQAMALIAEVAQEIRNMTGPGGPDDRIMVRKVRSEYGFAKIEIKITYRKGK